MKDRALELKAAALAGYAHGQVNQRRKYTGEPYIMHPLEVAEIVSSVTGDSRVIAAALMHDVIEDTEWDYDRLEYIMGGTIAHLVWEVTDQSRPENGNRAERKAIDCNWLALSSPAGATIKLADLISNTRSIVQYDPKFAATYMREKRDLLPVLRHGNTTLWDRAHAIVEEYFASE